MVFPGFVQSEYDLLVQADSGRSSATKLDKCDTLNFKFVRVVVTHDGLFNLSLLPPCLRHPYLTQPLQFQPGLYDF